MLRQPRPLVPFAFERRVFQADLFRDAFGSGGVTSPRTSDVGYLKIVDTNAIMSVTGGQLVINGTGANHDGLIVSDNAGSPVTFARNGGRTLILKLPERTTVDNNTRMGFASDVLTSQNLAIGVDYVVAGTITSVRGRDSATALRTTVLGSNAHTLAFVMRGSGGRVIGYDSVGGHKLVWIYTAGSADLYAKLHLGTTAQNFKSDDWRVFDYASLANDYVDASVHVTPSVSGTTYTAQADGIHHLAFTLPGSPSANLVAVELRYRVQDASNYWTCYLKRNAGNTAWDLLVDSVSGGTATNRKTVTGVGTPSRLIVFAEGTSHASATETSGASTIQGSSLVNSTFQTQATIAAVWDASTTIGSLDSWALTNSLYDGLFA